MRWNDLFADLEGQLEFGHWQHMEQDAAELTRGMWSELMLMDRLRATIGDQVRIVLKDGRNQMMHVETVGPNWLGGLDETGAVLIVRDAIVGVDANLRRAVVPSKPLRAGPSMAAIYRGLARRREALQIIGASGDVIAEGTIDRVGQDHLDVAMHARDEFRRSAALQGMRIVAFDAILMVRASPLGFTNL